MLDKLFDKFKKTMPAEKTAIEVEAEFDRIKRQYANLGTSDIYNILTQYFLAKIEINRDVIETCNPMDKAQRLKEIELKAENRVMTNLIRDVEDMKEQAKL